MPELNPSGTIRGVLPMNSKNFLNGTSDLRPAEPQTIEFGPTAIHHLSSGNQPLFLLDYWRVLVKRRWVILGALGFMLAAAILVSLRTTRMYQAAGQITINRQNP